MGISVNNFWYLDFSNSILAPVFVFILLKTKTISKFTFYLFWIGFLIGLGWELPLVLTIAFDFYPCAFFHTPIPVFPVGTQWLVLITAHSMGDGLIFLMGYYLVKKIRKSPFTHFCVVELLIWILFGQFQSIIVEVFSVWSGAWEYIPYKLNPSIFIVKGHAVTLVPQLCWFVAPIVFYFIALKIKSRMRKLE